MITSIEERFWNMKDEDLHYKIAHILFDYGVSFKANECAEKIIKLMKESE